MRRAALLALSLLAIATAVSAETLDQRIDRLLAKMSTAQKVAQLHRTDTWHTADDPALGIPGLHMGDGPHGVGWHQSTSFPVTVGLTASWDDDLIYRVGEAIGKEFRARGKTQALAPTVDVIRDPRSGRNPESPSEDPYLASRYAVAFVRGLQSTSCIATAKHFELNTRQTSRHNLRPVVDDRTLFELYSPPFRTLAQEAGVLSIMNAYNFINGERCSESRHLLTEILRDQWGYPFYVISDWGSVWNAKAALEAGTDLEMASNYYATDLAAYVASGEVDIATLDNAVRRVLRTKLIAGLIDGQPLADVADIDSPAHRALAREAAQRSIVLLKNGAGILPFDTSRTRSLAVIGPSADVAQLDGIGSSVVKPTYSVTPLAGITTRAGADFPIHHARGCDIASDDTTGFAAAVAAAAASEAVVFVGGLDATMEGEERDRITESVALPGVQCQLITALAAANPNLVVVLEGGGAVSVSACLESIRGLLYAFYPGQEGGNAIADILFGDVNPAGRLPYTIPVDDAQLPPWELDHTRDLVDGRGYRWFDRKGLTPEFPFGFGLSYTTFAYGPVAVEPKTPALGEDITVSVEVTNTGQRAGDEVVQLYVRDSFGSSAKLPKELRGFRRIHLEPAETRIVAFTLGVEDYWHYDAKRGAFAAAPGMKVALVGPSSRQLASGMLMVKPAPPAADLVVSYLAWAPPYPHPGDTVNFVAMVRNRGSGASPPGVAHDLAVEVDGKPVAWSRDHKASIRPGEAVFLQGTNLADGRDWSPPTVGSFKVRATVNPAGTIPESITTNNSLEATLAASPRNLAFRRPVTVSSIAGPEIEGAHAVDGLISSQWLSEASDPQWIVVDLGVRVAIDRIRLSWDYGFARKYQLQVSDDRTTWTDLFTELLGDGGIDDIAVTGAGRYVRLATTERAASWGYALWELQVFGAPAPATE